MNTQQFAATKHLRAQSSMLRQLHTSRYLMNNVKRNFPRNTYLDIFIKDAPKMVGALVSVGLLTLFVPYTYLKMSNWYYNVPNEPTSAVILGKNRVPEVSIPQTYVHRDMPSDDDE
ncbi:Piso0_000716 [Millerozyma farinosa CBS 7064]|uniref:Piso0_000716 protein n=1 Tax=Pichia sorbitophila (strain ATCC MYA-4447 / BCRC 22081 / CBS 7064 / NBRC 10061 / NRRL Y-12695) TaxID=559304 RepID=G8YPV3_PICSO|nr:Piso0_000716 [Millerozyma farinosa CBS 7064]